MMGLTGLQVAVLTFIREFHARTGTMPTYREIMRAFDMTSSSAPYRVVHCLIQRGYIRMIPGHARSMRLTDPEKEETKATGAFAVDAEVPEGSENMERYERYLDAMTHHYRVLMGEPDPQTLQALRHLAVSIMPLGDAVPTARRLRMLGAAMNNAALTIEARG